METLFAILLGYTLGSIPFGLILTRLAGKGDIRKSGSGNIGATNVLRTSGKALGLTTLVLDAGKGALAVVLAHLFISGDAVYYTALSAVMGHIFPVWLKGRGGKGVATTLATVLALNWQVGVVLCAVWLAVFLVFRTSSLAAIAAMLALVPAGWIWGGTLMGSLGTVLAVIVIFRHRENISRLLRGEEMKMAAGKKKKTH